MLLFVGQWLKRQYHWLCWHGSNAGHSSGVAGVDARGRRPQIRGWRAGGSLAVASSTPATPLLSPAKIRELNHAAFASLSYPANRQVLRNPHVGRPGFLVSKNTRPRTAVRRGRHAGLLLIPNCQRWSARSRHTQFTTRSPESCERLRRSEIEASLGSSLRGVVSAPRSRPGSPGGARPDARRLAATGLGWRRRIGPAAGPRPASATAPASSRRCCPTARRPRPAHRRSRLCPRGTTARCTPPGAGNCPARTLRSSLRVTNPAGFDPRPDRTTAPPPDPPPQSSPRRCLLGRPAGLRFGPAPSPWGHP